MNKTQKLEALQKITALKFQKESAKFAQLQAKDAQLKEQFDVLEQQKSIQSLQPQSGLNLQAKEMVIANWLRWIAVQQRAVNMQRIEVRVQMDQQKAQLTRAHGEKSVSSKLKHNHMHEVRAKLRP